MKYQRKTPSGRDIWYCVRCKKYHIENEKKVMVNNYDKTGNERNERPRFGKRGRKDK